MHPFSKKLLAQFTLHSDGSNAIPMKQYMKNIADFYGIKSPERRSLFRQVYASFDTSIIADYRSIAKELFLHDKREAHYSAIDFLEKSISVWDISTIDLLEELICTKSWWDTVDALAPLIGIYFQKYPSMKKKYIKRWIASNNMWLQRTCLIFQKRYKHETDEHLLFSLCKELASSKEFFIKKGMGWALREYAAIQPEAVMNFVNTHSLSTLTTKEAIRKIIA